ncbi:hypothetical protein G9A89_010407 [Geosiphon pyriformis]|nr:hypothetical protein G9A89_010407 [Geosiphon pyriformis]
MPFSHLYKTFITSCGSHKALLQDGNTSKLENCKSKDKQQSYFNKQKELFNTKETKKNKSCTPQFRKPQFLKRNADLDNEVQISSPLSPPCSISFTTISTTTCPNLEISNMTAATCAAAISQMPTPTTVTATTTSSSATSTNNPSSPAVTVTTTPSINTLVIDDNIITGKILSKILEKEFGHHVTCLESGEAALEALSQEVFDICFLDIDMPGINGVETTLAIRQMATNGGAEIVANLSPSAAAAFATATQILEPNRAIPIIAYTTNECSQRFLDCGMNGFLSKPATLETLRNELERIF